jgi:hypothetical protein
MENIYKKDFSCDLVKRKILCGRNRSGAGFNHRNEGFCWVSRGKQGKCHKDSSYFDEQR